MDTLLNNNDVVVAKKNRLDEVSYKLKSEFVGLDQIIDNVMKVVSAWYIFPQAQTRPCIINLWGLTGSGKTALVKALVEHLDHKKYYAHFDMGEHQSHTRRSLRRAFNEDLGHFNNQQGIVCFDEFQFARTIDEYGDEVNNDQLRMVWELMDSGNLYNPSDVSNFYISKGQFLVELLNTFKSRGGEIRDGEAVEKTDLFIQLLDRFYFYDQEDRYVKKTDVAYFKSKDFVSGILSLDDNETPRAVIERKIASVNIDGMISFLEGLIKKAVTPTELNLQHSLIFVLGNLDEAYNMTSNLDPDMEADHVHELTQKITVPGIKDALLKRFRAEQIARLGNNHFIYRSFSSKQFREVIQRELNRLSVFTKEQLGWTLVFDKSIVDVIYSEGVIPTQGTRPVYTTINNLIQSRFGHLAIHASTAGESVSTISFSCENSEFKYELRNSNNEIVSVVNETVELTMMKQRMPIDPNIQAHTAVHESGHAITAALLFRIVPALVVSRSASANSEGFCTVRFPKGPMTRDSLMMDIAVTLGGLAAEKIVFGKEFTCAGVGSDISEASRLANNAVRRFGMGSDPIRLSVLVNNVTQDYFADTSVYEEEAVKLIRDCMLVAEALLERNKLLLLKMSDYLTVNSRMDMKMIEEFVRAYSNEDWVNEEGFVEPEDYYAFDRIVKEQLDKLSVGCLAESLSY